MVAKKIQTFILILFILIILFFTFFGETLYSITKPQVETVTPNLYTINGENFMTIPKSAYNDGVVYKIESQTGFSTVLNKIYAVKIEVKELGEYYEDVYWVENNLSFGERIVKNADIPLIDGEYVIILHN